MTAQFSARTFAPLTGVAACILMLGAISTAAGTPMRQPINMRLNEAVDFDGSETFHFSVQIQNHSLNRIERLLTPRGRLIFGDGLFVPAIATTFQSLLDQVVGEWVYTTAVPDDPASLQEYRFSIVPFDRDVVVQPVITSPANGAAVTSPTIFTFTPATNLSTIELGPFDTEVPPRFSFDWVPGRLSLEFEPYPYRDWSIRFAAGNVGPVPGAFVLGQTPGVDRVYDLDPQLMFRRDHAIRVFPVPEPSSAILAGWSLWLCARLRSRGASVIQN